MEVISPELHVAIMVQLVMNSKDQKIGRTQLMKLCYFLQEIEQVPTSYDFRLFNYGPFDSDVLVDLSKSCGGSLLKEKSVNFQRGYGYEITPGDNAYNSTSLLPNDLAEKVKRLAVAFSGDGAGELELKSTILFVDREFARENKRSDKVAIANRVRSIKPHFSLETILGRIDWMYDKGYLNSLTKND